MSKIQPVDATAIADAPEHTADAELPTLVPEVAVFETDHALALEVDLPGVGPSDAEVLIENGVLTVTATPKALDRRYLRREFRHGRYFRSFRLSDRLDANALTARLENGVLRIEIPLAKHCQPRRIEVS